MSTKVRTRTRRAPTSGPDKRVENTRPNSRPGGLPAKSRGETDDEDPGLSPDQHPLGGEIKHSE